LKVIAPSFFSAIHSALNLKKRIERQFWEKIVATMGMPGISKRELKDGSVKTTLLPSGTTWISKRELKGEISFYACYRRNKNLKKRIESCWHYHLEISGGISNLKKRIERSRSRRRQPRPCRWRISKRELKDYLSQSSPATLDSWISKRELKVQRQLGRDSAGNTAESQKENWKRGFLRAPSSCLWRLNLKKRIESHPPFPRHLSSITWESQKENWKLWTILPLLLLRSRWISKRELKDIWWAYPAGYGISSESQKENWKVIVWECGKVEVVASGISKRELKVMISQAMRYRMVHRISKRELKVVYNRAGRIIHGLGNLKKRIESEGGGAFPIIQEAESQKENWKWTSAVCSWSSSRAWISKRELKVSMKIMIKLSDADLRISKRELKVVSNTTCSLASLIRISKRELKDNEIMFYKARAALMKNLKKRIESNTLG